MTLIIGTLLGFLTGLGVGGGSLLMVWLTAVLGMDPHTARSVNLLFFLPGAAMAIFFRKHQGVIQRKKILSPAIAGCIAAMLCSRLSTAVDNSFFQKTFGILLLAAGTWELLWREK